MVMTPFKKLIEFYGIKGRKFYNKDIKCPICGEIMWFDSSQLDSSCCGNLHLACKDECCEMNIKLTGKPILWDDDIK